MSSTAWSIAISLPFLHLLLVGAGGFAGAVMRYLVSAAMPVYKGLPSGTLIVNVIGSLILSVMVFSDTGGNLVYLVNIGALGSFTTFSTFSYESFRLLESGESRLFAANVSLNVCACMIAVYVGKVLVGL